MDAALLDLLGEDAPPTDPPTPQPTGGSASGASALDGAMLDWQAASARDPNYAFKLFLYRYRTNTPLFVREVIGKEPDQYQVPILCDYDAGERQISVRSGHGIGKSATLSWIATHHILTKFPQKTVMTAPSSTQLWDALWAEFIATVRALPPFLGALLDIKADRVTLKAAPEESFATARTARADTPEAMQGIHATHVLLIGDEASAIPDPVFEASMGSMSGHQACMLLAGNPTRNTGYFAETHKRLRHKWRTHHISCVGHPRVSQDMVESFKIKYGEGSNAYRVRVLGEFPKADDDAIIAYELAEAATQRDAEPNPLAPAVWGLDVARSLSRDRNCLAMRKGNVVTHVEAFHCPDLMQVVGRVVQAYNATAERPEEICVDVNGLGAGVYDRLHELGLPVVPVNTSETAQDDRLYANRRTELWFRGREWLQTRAVGILPKCRDRRIVEDVVADLAGTNTKPPNSKGQFRAESKDDMRARGVKSPDTADAILLTFAGVVGESSAVAASSGTRTRSSWNAPQDFSIGGTLC